MKVRVLVVDDSAVIRELFRRELSRDPEIDVIDTAVDAYDARDKIVNLKPDVVTLDIEMPRMDGITFLKKLMRHYPLPVIVVSSLSERGGAKAVEALSAGGIDVICKPSMDFRFSDLSATLIQKIKAASQASIQLMPKDLRATPKITPLRTMRGSRKKIVAIGASTGGPPAILKIIRNMPADAPGVVVVQHMPPKFTNSFAKNLNRKCEMEVKEARDGDVVERGKVLIAPGNYHMLLRRHASSWAVRINDGPRVRREKPSVDILFKSVAKHGGRDAIGVLLTGMGNDGAEGLLEIRKAGGSTIAQDAASCVIYGMPKEAIAAGGAKFVTSLNRIARQIAACVQEVPAPSE